MTDGSAVWGNRHRKEAVRHSKNTEATDQGLLQRLGRAGVSFLAKRKHGWIAGAFISDF